MERVQATFDLGALCSRSVLDVARALLGFQVVSTIGGTRVVAEIVETEAYGGPDDPASHAATLSGITARNRSMFGPPGFAYIYRSYGVHWCLNIVTGAEGVAGAVLVRGIRIVAGVAVALERRGDRRPLGAGPGRVGQILALHRDLDGHDLRRTPLIVGPGRSISPEAVGVSGRVGVSRATERPWRFYVRGAEGVSRPDGWRPGPLARNRNPTT